MTTQSTSGMALDIMFGPLRPSKILKKNKKKAEGPTHKGEDKAVYDTKESGSNSYASNNKKMIKALKRDA
tara:strand:+ start:5654 stop:5863 length:210 start_codon:yes stop_codon:yes gene_type:complete